MTLTDHLPRLLAGFTLGAATLVPTVALAPAPAGAGPASPPPCAEGEIPLPIPGPNGGVQGVTCVPCENLPATSPGSCDPPEECDPETEDCNPPEECDPETEDCNPPEECDPETEDCDDPDPGDDPDPDPVPDRPVVARPTFTG